MTHSEWYDFATSYWWLLFPIGWGAASLLQIWTRHLRATKALDLIKTCIDQGKEPPAALLEVLQPPAENTHRVFQPLSFWLVALLLSAAAIGFGALGWLRAMDNMPNSNNILFLAVLLGAGAAAFAIFALLLRAHRPDRT